MSAARAAIILVIAIMAGVCLLPREASAGLREWHDNEPAAALAAARRRGCPLVVICSGEAVEAYRIREKLDEDAEFNTIAGDFVAVSWTVGRVEAEDPLVAAVTEAAAGEYPAAVVVACREVAVTGSITGATVGGTASILKLGQIMSAAVEKYGPGLDEESAVARDDALASAAKLLAEGMTKEAARIVLDTACAEPWSSHVDRALKKMTAIESSIGGVVTGFIDKENIRGLKKAAEDYEGYLASGVAREAAFLLEAEMDKHHVRRQAEAEIALAGKPDEAFSGDVCLIAADKFHIRGTYYRHSKKVLPALLLLHQIAGTREDWKPLIEDLTGDFAILAIDIRGHGLSQKQKTSAGITFHTWDKFKNADWARASRDIDAAFEFLKITRTADVENSAIAGASIGANLAVNYASGAKHVRVVALLSPGLDYFSVKTERAVRKLRCRLFVGAGKLDAYSYTSSKKLQQKGPKGTVFVQVVGPEHGTELLPNADLRARLVEFLCGKKKEEENGGEEASKE